MSNQEFMAMTVRFPVEQWDEMKRISQKRKMSMNKTIAMLSSVGIECHKDMERVGLIGIIDIAYYIREKLKERPAGTQLTLPL